MLCYSCDKIGGCSIFQKLYKISNDFFINDCLEYVGAPELKYRKIAEHDDLMALIYDYFTNQIDSEELLGREYSDEEIRDIITKYMWQM